MGDITLKCKPGTLFINISARNKEDISMVMFLAGQMLVD